MYELKQKRTMTMFYNLLAKTNNTTLVLLVPMLCSFLIAFFSLKFFKRILPKDQGRAFAVNGALSEGKPRGAGIIFVTSFTLCTALFYPLDIENIIYLVLVYAAMLSGYFDDAAETPWGNLKKGLIDLVISLGIAFTYYFYNGSQVKLYITDSTFTIPAPLFIILAGVLVWTAINVTNCTDGVDVPVCDPVFFQQPIQQQRFVQISRAVTDKDEWFFCMIRSTLAFLDLHQLQRI